MSKAFADQVGAFVAKSNERMEAVYKQSIQDTISEAQQERGKGGNMPVDTGFLRATGDAALNKLPSGETLPTGEGAYKWSPTASLIIINQAKLGDSVYFGWAANYAQYMERRYGFARLAAQNWNQIVKRAAQALEKRLTK
jgi:hypothetical protein